MGAMQLLVDKMTWMDPYFLNRFSLMDVGIWILTQHSVLRQSFDNDFFQDLLVSSMYVHECLQLRLTSKL